MPPKPCFDFFFGPIKIHERLGLRRLRCGGFGLFQFVFGGVHVPLGVTQVGLAEHIGVPLQRVNELVRGKRGVTPETAWLLSQAFGTTPGPRYPVVVLRKPFVPSQLISFAREHMQGTNER